MNILITGIHGFVGSNLVSYLKDKHTIFGLDIVAPTKDGVKKTFAWKDLENDCTPSSAEETTLPHFDIVIHLAGKAHDTKNEAKADYTKSNCSDSEHFFLSIEEAKKS